MDEANELHIIGGNIAISNSPVQGPVRGQSLDRNVLAVLKPINFRVHSHTWNKHTNKYCLKQFPTYLTKLSSGMGFPAKV